VCALTNGVDVGIERMTEGRVFHPRSEYRAHRTQYRSGGELEGQCVCRMCVGCCMCIGESGGARDQENDGGRGISPPKVDTDSNVLSIGLA